MIKVPTCKPAVGKRFIGVAGLIFSLAALAQAQSRSDKPLLWYHPDTKMTAAERGDVAELKDLHRICVSIAPGLTSEGFRSRLQRQIFEELTQYQGLEIVKNPDQADLAILIRIIPAAPLAERRPGAPATSESYVSPINDVDFYVLTRGSKREGGAYAPRVIVHRHHDEAEPTTSGAVLDLGNLITKLKSLRGEK